MSKLRPTTRRGRKPDKTVTLPAQWEPRFLDVKDQRRSVVQLIRKRLQRLKEEAGCDSYQKEMLAEQAIFIAVQLETAKVDALDGKPFDAGQFTAMVNCLSGLLSKLGLKKSAVQVLDFDAYVASKTKAKSK